MHAHRSRKFFNHIDPLVDKLGALLDEVVGTEALRGGNVPGDGKDLAVLLQRQPRRDQRAAVFGSLHNDDAERQSADDPVADGEILRGGGRPQRKFRNHRARLGDLLRQGLVLPRIDHVNAGIDGIVNLIDEIIPPVLQ